MTHTTNALTAESSRSVLATACEAVGLNDNGATLVRIGSNAVYRLASPIIARVSLDELDNARLQVAVARWLANEGFPATRALDVEQPIEVDGHVTTLWESAAEQDEYASIDQVADVIRRLHALHAPASLRLPEHRPFAKLDTQLQYLHNIDQSDASFLHGRINLLRQQYDSLSFELPPGAIHGDANVGNVIRDRHGGPVLIDLDSFATGPREWDLVQTALFFERFGWHTEAEYQTFVDVYGFDIMSWPGYRVLADYREVSMTLWLSRKAGTDKRAADEVHKRVNAIKTGGDRRDWQPF